ncbi:MAG: tetratricopeptide repeat protein [Deltaproteobacteria bacterium]|nr:tetratricopeptide repeat protein [Deltaproteobacteria bacterium]
MQDKSTSHILAVGCFVLAISLAFGSGCSIPRLGMGGRYQEAKDEISRPRGGNIDKAIVSLEAIVRENPTYYDSLTLLGRAYYKRGRYDDAHMVLQRALAVNKDDEIAWLVLGLTQLRLGEDHKGLETLKGALTLASKEMREYYRGFPDWDRERKVRSTLRRAVLSATKGLEEKENLIRNVELVLARIDEEEWQQDRDKSMERIRETPNR